MSDTISSDQWVSLWTDTDERGSHYVHFTRVDYTPTFAVSTFSGGQEHSWREITKQEGESCIPLLRSLLDISRFPRDSGEIGVIAGKLMGIWEERFDPTNRLRNLLKS